MELDKIYLSFSFKTQYVTLGEYTLHVSAFSRDETYCVLKEKDTYSCDNYLYDEFHSPVWVVEIFAARIIFQIWLYELLVKKLHYVS